MKLLSILVLLASGTATLNWTPGPGTVPVDGYRVLIGPSASSLTKVADVGPQVRSYTVTGLAPGTYLGAVVAFNANGDSPASNLLSKAVDSVTPPPPPSQVLSTIGGPVYVAQPDFDGKFGWKRGTLVGTVTAKLKCTASYRIMTTEYYRVPQTSAAITWTGARATYVVAACKVQ